VKPLKGFAWYYWRVTCECPRYNLDEVFQASNITWCEIESFRLEIWHRVILSLDFELVNVHSMQIWTLDPFTWNMKSSISFCQTKLSSCLFLGHLFKNLSTLAELSLPFYVLGIDRLYFLQPEIFKFILTPI
jgi:hypothetical protein